MNVFEQIHIDVARNATDDFNLFHDHNKWRQIQKNPFNGPIVLGFQIESLIENKILQIRQELNELALLDDLDLRFSNYQLSFISALKPGQSVEIEIKESQLKSDNDAVLRNRLSVKADGKLAMTGYKKESRLPLFLPDVDFSELGDISGHPDRSYLSTGLFFLKRKFMNTSDAKNFLCGSLVDHSIYFDELEDKVNFPEIFPCSLISCALLEKGFKENHDFKQNPMVYTAHKISVDRNLLAQLKSNDALHILVKCLPSEGGKPLFPDRSPLTYECYGLVKGNGILYRALISLAPLAFILKKK